MKKAVRTGGRIGEEGREERGSSKMIEMGATMEINETFVKGCLDGELIATKWLRYSSEKDAVRWVVEQLANFNRNGR